MWVSKEKRIPPEMVQHLEEQNLARRRAGLPELKITIKICLACRSPFESLGQRTCGCKRGGKLSHWREPEKGKL